MGVAQQAPGTFIVCVASYGCWQVITWQAIIPIGDVLDLFCTLTPAKLATCEHLLSVSSYKAIRVAELASAYNSIFLGTAQQPASLSGSRHS